MKELLKKNKIIVFISLFFLVLGDGTSPPSSDGCEDDEIPIKQIASSDRCQKITKVLDNKDFQIGVNDLRGLSNSDEKIIQKNNYILEFFNLEDLTEKGKYKLYIPEPCLKLMELDQKIQLQKEKGIAILVSNYNIMNKNNLPEAYFVIRLGQESTSQVKYMNSKTFDFNFCHDAPILLNQTVSIRDLK